MSLHTTTTFDITGFARAIEERDAASQLAHYDEHAEVRLVDRDHPPATPLVLTGKTEIGAWVQDICARDMTHKVDHQVLSADRMAFTQACRYPNGAGVLCAAFVELRDGQIARLTGVQAWDD